MKTFLVVSAIVCSFSAALAQDWPQWRGPNRDARAGDFKAPKMWPKELTQKWKVTVGDGVATPALVGDKLYVFSREQGHEVTRALNAADRNCGRRSTRRSAREGPRPVSQARVVRPRWRITKS